MNLYRQGVCVHLENCKNPWNGACTNKDIQVYIVYGGRQLPICRACWNKIAETNTEW